MKEETFNGLYIDERGSNRWYKNGVLHREDGPAIIWYDGDQWWYKDGKLHREDGPAVIRPSGFMCWYKDDILHRDDGPAVIHPDGGQEWYKEDKLYEPTAHDLMVWKMNERSNIERTTH